METKTVIEYDGFKGYNILINGDKLECRCGCVVFGTSGDDHICNACNSKLVIPDLICISCHGGFVPMETVSYDTDDCGPYCYSCFVRLPKELKGE